MSKVVQGTTCFNEHEKHQVCCENKQCRQWFDNKETLNCVIIAAKEGPRTHAEVGDFFNMTRASACHICIRIQKTHEPLRILGEALRPDYKQRDQDIS